MKKKWLEDLIKEACSHKPNYIIEESGSYFTAEIYLRIGKKIEIWNAKGNNRMQIRAPRQQIVIEEPFISDRAFLVKLLQNIIR